MRAADSKRVDRRTTNGQAKAAAVLPAKTVGVSGSGDTSGAAARSTVKARWLSIEDIAAELGVSIQTVYKWSARRDGRSFPRFLRLPNGSIRVRSDWFEQWLAALECAS